MKPRWECLICGASERICAYPGKAWERHYNAEHWDGR